MNREAKCGIIHTMEYDLVLKRIHAVTWMNLENMLSEIS